MKAAVDADAMAVENCIGKCNVKYEGESLDQRENVCMKKCFIKFFDSAMLVEKEMTRYVHGHPIA